MWVKTINNPRPYKATGFTLIEIVIALSILGIIASLAIPSYLQYLQHSRLTEAGVELNALSSQLEKAFLDQRRYGENNTCQINLPTNSKNYFTYECSLNGNGYLLKATSKAGVGLGSSAGSFVYTLDNNHQQQTLAFDGATVSNAKCWILKKNESC